MARTTKHLTITYWNTLEEGSKRRALTAVFPLMPAVVDMLLNDEPKPKKDPWWSLVFKKVRVPEPDERGYRHYKSVINHTYYM